MVEHLVCNQVVVGSNPVASTTLKGAERGWADCLAERGRKRESTDCSARAQRCVIFENEVGCRKNK